MGVGPSKSRTVVVTLDAFGTIFHPRQPIGVLYAQAARECGLGELNPDEVGSSFRKAFKNESAARPNYGKAVGMDAEAWWKTVVHNTFTPLLSRGAEVPAKLVDLLYLRFSSEEGYALYPDVMPFFDEMRRLRNTRVVDPDGDSVLPYIYVGVVSNSDNRITDVMSSLGLRVPAVGSKPSVLSRLQKLQANSDGSLRRNLKTANSDPQNDLDFVVTSYDAGYEKPDPRIWKDVMAKSGELSSPLNLNIMNWSWIHVGDDYEKDYVGAKQLNTWDALLLRRGLTPKDEDPRDGVARISSLTEVPLLVNMKREAWT